MKERSVITAIFLYTLEIALFFFPKVKKLTSIKLDPNNDNTALHMIVRECVV